jgi:hypothetical protein
MVNGGTLQLIRLNRIKTQRMPLNKPDKTKKKLYFNFDNGDTETVMELSGCTAFIKADMEGKTEKDTEDLQYTLTPIWLTDKGFKNLPEAD